MIEHWEALSARTIAECRIFSVDMISKKRPSGQAGEFALIRSQDWVNILPLTDNGTVILIRQFRHGTNEVTLEIPGGIVEPGEDPLEAAMRECREETGYSGAEKAEFLGSIDPNPAIQDNRCYTYLWRGCRPVEAQLLDEHEDIEVVEVPLDEVRHLIRNGSIRHSLVLTTLFFYFMKIA
jgi:ADP-ribose pyrophosphatase